MGGKVGRAPTLPRCARAPPSPATREREQAEHGPIRSLPHVAPVSPSPAMRGRIGEGAARVSGPTHRARRKVGRPPTLPRCARAPPSPAAREREQAEHGPIRNIPPRAPPSPSPALRGRGGEGAARVSIRRHFTSDPPSPTKLGRAAKRAARPVSIRAGRPITAITRSASRACTIQQVAAPGVPCSRGWSCGGRIRRACVRCPGPSWTRS